MFDGIDSKQVIITKLVNGYLVSLGLDDPGAYYPDVEGAIVYVRVLLNMKAAPPTPQDPLKMPFEGEDLSKLVQKGVTSFLKAIKSPEVQSALHQIRQEARQVLGEDEEEPWQGEAEA